MAYYLAVDIGASSGRHVIGSVENGKLEIREMYRFENRQVQKNGHLCWDTEALYREILEGMRRCKEAGLVPTSMGIDTWAVDFVLLDGEGKLIGDPVAYRDSRTDGVPDTVEQVVSFAECYRRTGIQKLNFNTIYQLFALQKQDPAQLAAAKRLLMIPDYFHYRLTGVALQEYTNATSTGLVDAKTMQWDRELIETLGYPANLFEPLTMPGNPVGHLTPEVQAQVGFDCTVVLPATHDTGSAFLAVPAMDENAVYISSGTWSLLGVENKTPITTPESCQLGFTNEGGYQGRYRFLKNIMGLWMIQSVRNQSGRTHSFAELEAAARAAGDFPSVVDVNDNAFLAPDDMAAEVRRFCERTGQPVPQTIGELMQCIYHSLAVCYKEAVRSLSALTGKEYTAIHIVGGGSKDGYLNQLTAKETGLPVYAGPTEGTALGNLMVQMLADGCFTDLTAARRSVAEGFAITEYRP